VNPSVTTPFLTTANSGSVTNSKNVPATNPSCLVPNYTGKDNALSNDSYIKDKVPEANKDFLDYGELYFHSSPSYLSIIEVPDLNYEYQI
jgi:hypothetical protein